MANEENGVPLRELGLSHDPATGKHGGLLLVEGEGEPEPKPIYAVTLMKMSDGNVKTLLESEIEGEIFSYDRTETIALMSVLSARINAALTAESVVTLLESINESPD